MRRRIPLEPLLLTAALFASFVPAVAQLPPTSETASLQEQLKQVQKTVTGLRSSPKDQRLVNDVEVFAKGVEWCLRHGEFYASRSKKKDAVSPWIGYCRKALELANQRAEELRNEKHTWTTQTGSTIRGYVSRVDGSIQPYAVSLPAHFNDARPGQRFPLHVKLHGRGGTRNEVRFFNEHSGRAPQEGQNWIQLDVFGRTDNAYRWSGETDVFEAIADVSRRYRIDSRRITLWGFSMGGAGAWHLGLHHPSKWSSVGPGAGFVDFYKYQNQSELRPPHQHRALRIYDSIDYALNMANVPFCTYGGELDKQLVASTKMIERGKELGVEAKLLIGPEMGHKFHPDSYKEFMAFHTAKSLEGRPRYPGRRRIRFVTWTLKYNQCEWLTIEELEKQYEETVVEGGMDIDGVLRLDTQNVAALRIARDLADRIDIDGDRMELRSAADGLLPDVYYERTGDDWTQLSYDDSIAFQQNDGLQKRHNLQGPIDDAFMEPFVCVRGTGVPWSKSTQDWADWTLQRFETEFDKWLRGRIPVINDTELSDEDIASKNLILFGDPGSNAVIARVLDKLPVTWKQSSLNVNGQQYDTDTHGLSLIYPNPLNPRRYVVINSGHTMHEKDFRASNSWLFPRLGDIAVQQFVRQGDDYEEATAWAGLFNSSWGLSAAP